MELLKFLFLWLIVMEVRSHAISVVENPIDGASRRFQMKMDIDFEEGNADVSKPILENEKSGSKNWIELYCSSKVGVTRAGFPCEVTMKQNQQELPRSCKDVRSRGYNKSGIYEIQPKKNGKPFNVLCDMEIRGGGGWTHIHKRFDGSVDFYRGWREYKFGFGDLNGEFWIGLENIHLMTGQDSHELLVEIVNRDGVFGYAHYESFAIGSEENGYPLERLSGYSGDAGESLVYHKGMKFTTKDVDQDKWDDGQCAHFGRGAWWYNNCFASNLNGELINHEVTPKRTREGMSWDSFTGRSYVHSKARMLIRPH